MADLPPIDPACQAAVDTAVHWMLDRVYALPEAVRHPGEWPEYAALLAHEQFLSQACLAGDVEATKAAARAYCAAWLASIKQQREK